MKRILAVLLVMALCLGGCGRAEEPAAVTEVTEATEATEVTEATEAATPVVIKKEPEKLVFEGTVAPEGWDERKLSDEEIQALTKAKPQAVREAISTAADATYYLNLRFPELLHNYWTVEDGMGKYAAPEVKLAKNYKDPLSRPDMVHCVMWLLEDDFTIGMLLGVCSDDKGKLAPVATANYVCNGEKYVVFDPVIGMEADEGCRYGSLNLMMEWKEISLEKYAKAMAAARGSLWKIYAWEGAGEILLEMNDGPRKLEIHSPEAKLLYHNQEDTIKIGSKPENIEKYDIVNYLGGLTLTVEEAKALVEAEPEVVQEKVKTAADVLLYMLAAKITDCYGDKTIYAGGQEWHYNLNAYEVMETRTGNCGASANLANYLLDGDYEEVGFMYHVLNLGGGGSHIYSYIKHEGKYYIIDYSWYVFSFYSLANDFPVMVLDSLEDYANRFRELYQDVCMIMAYDTPGQHYPNIFGEDGVHYLPEDAEFTWIYREETDRAYKHGTKPLPKEVPDWRVVG